MPSTNGHGPKRAILYTRVSTDEQARSGYSIPDQLKELRGHAVREGYQVVEEIEDEGYSGADPYRPGLQRVMQLAETGEIDVVIAAKRDRLFRSHWPYQLQGRRTRRPSLGGAKETGPLTPRVGADERARTGRAGSHR
jgi:predicted site-specific integrase-resolvase